MQIITNGAQINKYEISKLENGDLHIKRNIPQTKKVKELIVDEAGEPILDENGDQQLNITDTGEIDLTKNIASEHLTIKANEYQEVKQAIETEMAS